MSRQIHPWSERPSAPTAEPEAARGGYALFPTPIGHCALVWQAGGQAPGARLLGAQLPEEGGEACTRTTVQRRFRGLAEAAMPPTVAAWAARVAATLAGVHDDLCDVPLTLHTVSPFYARVYELARRIPPGTTLTYGQMAAALGAPGAARAVGQALGRNPFAPVVPCHRILAAGGRPGGFSAGGGAATKLRMLQIEGALPGGTLGLFPPD